MDLQESRAKIDNIDDEILELFLKRMEVASEVAAYKVKNNMPIINTAREREILSRISKAAGDGMGDYSRILFSTLFQLSRSYQDQLIADGNGLAAKVGEAIEATPRMFPEEAMVACQGVEGAYSQQACDKLFSFASILYFKSFEGVFHAVEKGLCKYGLLPIENSAHGSVNEVYDLMKNHSFYIVRSIKLHVSHSLLARKGVSLDNIKEIISHEQAIGQCSAFLAARPNVKITLCENTAVAAKLVAESGRDDLAAISSPECAEMYGLSVLKSAVHNTDNNYTRFILISKNFEIYPGADKISVMFTLPNEPGALSKIMMRFSALGINLTKLESRPMQGTNFSYVFYADLEASVYSEKAVKLISQLEKEIKLFVLLGAYSEKV